MAHKIQFGVYELDRDAAELRKHGMLIRLQEQPLRVLVALVERPGEIVTREELQEKIWGKDTFVDFDQSLNKAVNRIREALNDDAGTPRYVETVPRRGYRFVAPVTGNTPIEPRGAAAPSSAVSDSDVRKSGPRSSSVRKIAALAMAGILVALGIAGGLLRKPRKSRQQEARHMTSAGSYPTLSRDGTLLAYVSTVGGDVPHIWIQQTAGGEAIPVTKGPDADLSPDFSPDGTHIAFASTRGGNGIYLGSTLPGETRLLVRRAVDTKGGWGSLDEPRFSPRGDKLLYWEHYSKAAIVPVNGGQPIPLDLNRDFRLYGTPRWSPSGNEVIFCGVRVREAGRSGGWWIAPLKGGDPKAVRLPGVEGENKGTCPSVWAWTRTKGGLEWIVYSVSTDDAWKLFRIGISAQGQIDEKPELLTSGTGELGDNVSLSEDGQLAYAITSLRESIYEIPTNGRGQKLGPTLQLPLSGEGDERSPSVSRDGRWVVYTSTLPGKPYAVLLKDLGSGADRFLDDRDHRPAFGGDTSISPDGSKVISERDCNNSYLPCGFLVSVGGEQPGQVCEFCIPRGFSSNGSVVLIQKYDRTRSEPHDRIVALDLATKTETDFLDAPSASLYHAFFSWDDHWVVFKKQQKNFATAQILIAPVRNGVASKEAEWIVVTDGSYSDDKPQFSPDGNTVYFTSTRDGYLCIWVQRLDPTTKRPLGAPVAYEHFHNSLGRDASRPDMQSASDLTVARDKILINLPQIRSDIWIVQVR
jgi:Tol biopolymer transport system component/DNA-binding winged helix-turn-helix (wHTH) protein